jgi:hypothetical protein
MIDHLGRRIIASQLTRSRAEESCVGPEGVSCPSAGIHFYFAHHVMGADSTSFTWLRDKKECSVFDPARNVEDIPYNNHSGGLAKGRSLVSSDVVPLAPGRVGQGSNQEIFTSVAFTAAVSIEMGFWYGRVLIV